jgi:hypothetical protein
VLIGHLMYCSLLLSLHQRSTVCTPGFCMYFQTRRTTHRSAATGKSSAEPLPGGEEPTVLRRSRRSRTPTRHFESEISPTTPRKQQTAAAPPTKPPNKKSPRKRQHHLEEEEDTDEEEFDVQRSEYELRSHFARRKSPRRIEERHYFHSEVPQPRKTQGSNGSTSADSTTLSQFGGTTDGGAAAASNAVLSSDEEEERRRGGQGSSVTPQISVYESRVRKRLSSLSSLTRKKVAEALTGLAGRKDDEPASSQSKSALPPPEASQPAEPPAHLSSSHHVYETHSRTTDPHPTDPSLSPVVTRRKLRSTTVTTAAVPSGPKARDPPPSSEDASTDSPPDLTAFETQPWAEKTPPVLSTTNKFPQWMKFGWEEMFFIFIVISLLLFAYYCFYSDDC